VRFILKQKEKMTSNNEEFRSRRNYDNANNERHYSSNDNQGEYNRERGYNQRPQNDRSYHSSDNRERSYNQSYNQNYRNYDNVQQGGNSYGNGDNQDGAKKRRMRVGERVTQQVNNNNRGNYGQDRRSYDNNGGGNYGYRNNDDGYGNRDNRPNRPYNNNRGGQGGYGDRNQPYGNNRPYNANNQGGGGQKKLVKKKKPFTQIKYKENADPNAPLRLNKYLSNAGICSRREADEFIQAGVVKVNGVVITELGTKVTRADSIMFHDQPVQPESKVYVLLNKPKGFVTTTDDPENRKTVMDLVKSACPERIYPVGRLDRSTTGVLLLTNDGDLASKLTHPKYEKRKIYQVWLDKPVAMEHMQAIADGIELEDGEIHADAISYVTEEDLSVIGIEIHSGRNRIVRRIFEKLGYRVVRLDRVYFAGLTKKKLSRGKWRYLLEQEVNMLRMGAFD
jgi:23S rRNA pseudouridine2605 synthase